MIVFIPSLWDVPKWTKFLFMFETIFNVAAVLGSSIVTPKSLESFLKA